MDRLLTACNSTGRRLRGIAFGQDTHERNLERKEQGKVPVTEMHPFLPMYGTDKTHPGLPSLHKFLPRPSMPIELEDRQHFIPLFALCSSTNIPPHQDVTHATHPN